LFEAFAGEFAVSMLNENEEIAKLKQALQDKDAVLAETKKVAATKAALVESKDLEIQTIKEQQERKETLTELMKPLNKEKQEVMSQLLENIQTDRLKSAYEKYLPAVLNNSAARFLVTDSLTKSALCATKRFCNSAN